MRRSGRGRTFKPVKVGEEYDVRILAVGSQGDGIAKIKGLVIFVPDTNVGDQVRIRITRVGRRFAVAEKV
ncbi:MAG: deoxyribonuclease [Thermoprotei archaeon]|nr:MAG: deoxyribonuclease [Thermoprotei archaeon]